MCLLKLRLKLSNTTSSADWKHVPGPSANMSGCGKSFQRASGALLKSVGGSSRWKNLDKVDRQRKGSRLGQNGLRKKLIEAEILMKIGTFPDLTK